MITVHVVFDTTTTTGIEKALITGTGVFPNPASEYLHVNTGSNPVESVSIYNPLGQLLLYFSAPSDNEIPIGNLPAGAYVASIKVAGNVYNFKWVKM